MLRAGLAFQPCPIGAMAADEFRLRIADVHVGFADGIRPLFPPPMVDEATDAGFASLMEQLARIFKGFLRSLLERDGADATLQALGYSAPERQLLAPYCTPQQLQGADALLRFDALQTQRGLQVVELNAAAGIGGIGLIEGYDQAFAASAFHHHLADVGWQARSRHPLDSVAHLLRRLGAGLCEGLCDGPAVESGLHVALVVLPRDLHYQQTAVCARYLQRAGLKVSVATADEVEPGATGVRLRGEPVHVVWAVHTFEAELIDPALRERAEALRGLAAQRRVAYLVPPGAGVLGNKALFPLLLGQQGQALLHPADYRVVTQAVPATWRVQPALVDWLAAQQPGLVLKPARGVSGRGILFGPQVGERAWRMGLDRILASGVTYVAQRLCLPQPCEVPEDGAGRRQVNVVLGGICVDGAYAGHFVRALDADSTRPINVSFGGTMAPCYVLSRHPGHRST